MRGKIKMAEQKIENIINEKLTGDAQKNALDFISFLRANDITIDPNDDGVGFAVGGIAGNSGGYLHICGNSEFPGPWTFWFNSCDFEDDGAVDDNLKEAAWNNIGNCGKCHDGWKDCGGGDRVIFGKVIENCCNSPLFFNNPDTKMLEYMEKLLLMLK